MIKRLFFSPLMFPVKIKTMRCPILYYHLIGDPPPHWKHRSIWMPANRFERQLKLLRRLGYRTISPQQFEQVISGGISEQELHKKIGGRPCMITFDDGHLDNYTTALPLLKEYGFTATVFVVAGKVGERLPLRAGPAPEGEPIMNADQIREWVSAGMHVQSHGLTHESLADMRLDDVRHEMRRSKNILEDITQQPIDQFCFPFGLFKTKHFTLAEEIGYKLAYSTVRGRDHHPDERYCLKRIPVHYQHNPLHFINALRFKSYRRSEAQLRQRLESRREQ